MANYATKSDLKCVDESKFSIKTDLANLKLNVDELDIDKLKTPPVDLYQLSGAVDNDVVKKAVNNKLVTKVNATDTSGFVSKTQYNTDKSGLEKKINDADKKNT